MGPDRKKQFMKKNPDLIPADENVLAMIIAEAKGQTWRRSIKAGIASVDVTTSALVDAVDTFGSKKEESVPAGDGGDASRWPEAEIFWVGITDKQLHAFQGQINSQKAGPGAVHYPLDSIANMSFDKKLMVSKFNVEFRDGSSIVLDVTKQSIKPFVEAIEAHSASA